ncbi:aldehyde dehydrogenase family protein [Xanthovirga aplysinae]|uniref:aldehyde dehydrogenase family protein n=1 Tax=Xanthovirga aplysinae TaxID=2529853 RepID=UPI0031B6016B
MKINAPYDGSLIKEIEMQDGHDVEHALAIAYDLFQNRNKWLPAEERRGILERTELLMKNQVEELTQLAAREGGKPYMDSKAEVLRAINGIRLAIEHMSQMKGTEIPMNLNQASSNRLAYTFREPIGVVASISAFNHPLNLIVHQTVPAIAIGAPVIIKPALTTPLSCLHFMEILYKAGLPKEWCQCLIVGDNHASELATDPRINYFSFIGSAKVGWHLRSHISAGTRCALEHGGLAPVIVEPDADLDKTIPLITKGGFYHAGQVCVSVQRVFVHDSIKEKFSKRLKQAVEQLKVGDPLDPETEVGPLILPREVNRVGQWVNEAREEGGNILCGGRQLSDSIYAPTILMDPSIEAKVSTLEIFGPVLSIYSYKNRRKAIDQANALPYGFQAAVFTQNIDKALDTVKRLNASAVMVNDHTAFRVDWMPFGGRDMSGLGWGGIPYSMHEMSREKLMVIKSDLL